MRPMGIPGCEETRQALDAWIAGKLDGTRHQAVRAHLDGCAACREALEDRDPLSMFAALGADSPRPDEAWDGFWDGIREGIRRDGVAAVRRRRVSAWTAVAGVAAALVMLVAAFLLAARPGPRDGTSVPPAVVAAHVPPPGAPRPQTVEQVLTPGSRPVQIFSMAWQPDAAGAEAGAPGGELVLIVDAGLEL